MGSTTEFSKLAHPPKHLAVSDLVDYGEKTYGELRADLEPAAGTSRSGFPVAGFGRGDRLRQPVQSSSNASDVVASVVRATLELPQDGISVETVENLPRTARGKKDYQGLGKRTIGSEKRKGPCS